MIICAPYTRILCFIKESFASMESWLLQLSIGRKLFVELSNQSHACQNIFQLFSTAFPRFPIISKVFLVRFECFIPKLVWTKKFTWSVVRDINSFEIFLPYCGKVKNFFWDFYRYYICCRLDAPEILTLGFIDLFVAQEIFHGEQNF